MTGTTVTTVEAEWDERAVDEILASIRVETRMCRGCATDLGLSTDPDLARHGVDVDPDVVCYVCQAKDAYERKLHDLHEKDPAYWDGRAVTARLVRTDLTTEGGGG